MGSSFTVDEMSGVGEQARDEGNETEGFGRLEMRGQRLEMPLFEGDDLDGWVFRAERYFAVNHLADAEKLDSVALCFKGAALAWFQWEQRRRK